MDSGNQLQRQKKAWSLGKEIDRTWGKKRGKGMSMLQKEKKLAQSSKPFFFFLKLNYYSRKGIFIKKMLGDSQNFLVRLGIRLGSYTAKNLTENSAPDLVQ